MDLKIEHIAPYLPSSLKVIMEGKKTDIAWISTKHIVVIRPDGSNDIKKIPWKHAAINVKFVLKSLFELRLYQKEIKALGYRIDGNNFLNLMSDIESGVAGYSSTKIQFINSALLLPMLCYVRCGWATKQIIMKIWSTEMQVLNQKTKELHWVEGMRVKAFTKEKAQELLDRYNYHYLVLGDEIVAEIPCKLGTLEPDWCKMIDYEIIQNN